MRDLIKYALLGFGGWMLYNQFYGTIDIPDSIISGSSEEAANQSTLDTKGLMAEVIAEYVNNNSIPNWDGSGRMTYDQWDYFYHIVRGVHARDFEAAFPNGDRELRMSMDEWFFAQPSGFSGLSRGAIRGGGTSQFERARKRYI